MICVVFETQFLLSTQTREISHYKANELLAPFRNLSCYLIFGGREGRKRTNVLSENLLIQFTRKFNLVGLLELKIKATWEVGTSHKRALLDIAASAARTDPSNSALESWGPGDTRGRGGDDVTAGSQQGRRN